MKQLCETELNELKETLSTPVSFFRVATGYMPYSYQQNILNDTSNRIIFRSGRQVGKSEVIASIVMHTALTNDNQLILITAPTQRQSDIIFTKICRFIANLEKIIPIKSIIDKMLSEFIKFDNGSEIHCLPSGEGDNLRGFSPNLLIVDEAAFVKEKVFTAIEPSIIKTQGRYILISTPFGKRGRFYNTYMKDDTFSKYYVKSEDCPDIKKEVLEQERKNKTEIEFRREYLGEFIEIADNFFSSELITNCIGEYNSWKNSKEGYDYYLGVDCARFGLDETVFIIGAVDKEGNIFVVNIISTAKKPTTDTMGRIINLHQLWNFKSIYVDETGLGGGVVDVLNEFSDWVRKLPIKGVTFTLQEKDDMYSRLKISMEQSRIKFLNHPKLISQMVDLMVDYTSTGNKKIHHPEGGHDDYCFVAGTKILTNKGQISIEKIKVGDLVMTRCGYKKVTNIGNRYDYVISRLGLTGTPDHPIIISKGTKKLKYVTPSDKLYIWNEKQLYIMETSIIDTQILKEDIYENNTEKRKVYNLSIEDVNEYFANNILVHNCDSLSLMHYAIWNKPIESHFGKFDAEATEKIEFAKKTFDQMSAIAPPPLAELYTRTGIKLDMTQFKREEEKKENEEKK